MKELEKRIYDRYCRRYGYNLDQQRLLVKLLEEAGELARAVLRGDKENAKEELGDCIIVLASIAKSLDTDIETATAEKLVVHEQRLVDWEKSRGK